MTAKLRQRLPLLVVAVIAIGAYAFGPAIAANFLTKKSAKKTFITKKAGLTKKAGNKKFLKKGAAAGFAKTGDSYTKAEADSAFEPNQPEDLFVSVHPGSWYQSAENGSPSPLSGAPGSGGVQFTAGLGAPFNNMNLFAGVPHSLRSTATVKSVRFCFSLSAQASMDYVDLELTNSSDSEPFGVPVTISTGDSSAVGGTAECRTLPVAPGTTIDPTDLLGFTIQADFASQGSSMSLGSVTVRLET